MGQKRKIQLACMYVFGVCVLCFGGVAVLRFERSELAKGVVIGSGVFGCQELFWAFWVRGGIL